MTTETGVELSPDYQQVKQRIKQENEESLAEIKFHQGEFGWNGFDESFDVPGDESGWTVFAYGLLALLAVWAFIGAYHYYDALYSVLALGSI